jgi:undecaprenyl-phosphate 4-deoxy-4-formamido-L-arabinose transferase
VSIGSVIIYFVVMANRVIGGEPLTALRTFWDRDLLQFFLIGIVLFGLGLVGEYVGRIYQQVRERPRWLIQAVLEKETSWDAKRSSSATGT